MKPLGFWGCFLVGFFLVVIVVRLNSPGQILFLSSPFLIN